MTNSQSVVEGTPQYSRPDINRITQEATIKQIASDIALSPLQIDSIKEAYNLSDERLEELANDPIFIATYDQLSSEAKKDSTFVPQTIAREAVTSLIPKLLGMIDSQEVMNMDKLTAAKLLTTIANVAPKEGKNTANAGVQVNLHFGTKSSISSVVSDNG